MDDLISTTTEFIATHRFWAGPIVGLLAFSESLAVVGIFIPGTAILLSVGGLIGAGLLDPVATALWAFSGAVAANWVSYSLGRKIGPRAYRSWPLNRDRTMVARARLFFRRYGFASVFLSRFLGPMRAIVPAVAGVMEMNLRRFHVANLASGVLWIAAIFAPGYVAADSLGGAREIGAAQIAAFAGGIAAITIVGTWLGARVLRGGSGQRPNRRKR